MLLPIIIIIIITMFSICIATGKHGPAYHYA